MNDVAKPIRKPTPPKAPNRSTTVKQRTFQLLTPSQQDPHFSAWDGLTYDGTALSGQEICRLTHGSATPVTDTERGFIFHMRDGRTRRVSVGDRIVRGRDIEIDPESETRTTDAATLPSLWAEDFERELDQRLTLMSIDPAVMPILREQPELLRRYFQRYEALLAQAEQSHTSKPAMVKKHKDEMLRVIFDTLQRLNGL